MDVHYIEVRYKIKELKNFNALLKIIPKKIGIATTLQFLDIARYIKNELLKRGYEVYTGKSPYIQYNMQVLGCDPLSADVPVDTILFVGEGLFHPVEIVRRLNKKVIAYSPITGDIKVLSNNSDFVKKIYILIYKLKSSKVVGFVTSIKPGQYLYNELLHWKKVLERKGKTVYLFITDNIDLNEFQNFPQIEFWVIFACPRLIDDILDRKINAITHFYLRYYGRHHGLCEFPECNTSKRSYYEE